MAATYAALLSLARSLHQILELEQYIDHPLTKEKIASVHEKVVSIITFLENYSDKHLGALDLVGKEIREAAYEVQDFMDSYLYSVLRAKYDSSSLEYNCDEVSLDHGLNMAFERIHFVWEEAMKLNNSDPAKDLRSRSYSSPGDDSPSVKIAGKSMVVGFEDDLNAINERLYDDSTNLQITPIVGMGGIGKTTLARKAYDDSLLAQYFDIRAWITVSQEYQRRKILSELLENFNGQCFQPHEESEAKLAKLVYQNLFGRRYLIVIDDVWSNEAWQDLKMIFPDDGTGSRILLTTRLSHVAIHTGSTYAELHQMKFLNEDHSWELLRIRVFGKESACPLQLVEIGKKIARNCGGLPLTIVVVAGLLRSSGNVTGEELWETISENISFSEPTIALHCSKVLYLSYDRLPLGLKPCFLYITAFPEDSEIDVSKLNKFWIAEGFIKPDHDQSKCLEDVGERYLEDLVNRNLLLVGEKRLDGKLKTVGVHDLLREICMTKAGEEGFFHYISKLNTKKYMVQKTKRKKITSENPNHRLSIHFEQDFQEWQILDSTVRSAIFFARRGSESELPLGCRRLKVLDAQTITWMNFPDVISTFVNLRYISLHLDDKSCPHGFPASISKLLNLQTLIVLTNIPSLQVPFEILEMPKLRHFIIEPCFVSSCPSNIGVVQERDLQTLEKAKNFKFTKEEIKLLLNTKKMSLIFEHYDWDDLSLENLFHLQKLEELRVDILDYDGPSRIWNYAFPISLRSLILIGVCVPWDNMNIIGSLPNLQMLEIFDNSTSEVSEWMPIEGQFLRLKCLHSSLGYLVRWEVEKEHFPSLESLILVGIHLIDEIPYGIGEINTLQLIQLHYCRESVVNSAKQIKEQQVENGNNDFQVRVYVFGAMGNITRFDV